MYLKNKSIVFGLMALCAVPCQGFFWSKLIRQHPVACAARAVSLAGLISQANYGSIHNECYDYCGHVVMKRNGKAIIDHQVPAEAQSIRAVQYNGSHYVEYTLNGKKIRIGS